MSDVRRCPRQGRHGPSWLVPALAATLVLGAPALHAQDGEGGEADQEREGLGTIVITAPRVERDLLDTPAAVDQVRAREIRQGRRGVKLDEALNQVPGFFFQNQYNHAQGLRISTRGFGSRAQFGVRGIRIRVDGFPETLPDGQAQTDAIDLDAADRIEVVRGPSSALYGNATGGVIDITTADGRDVAYSPVFSADAGSHGYRKLEARAGGDSEDWAYHASLSALESDGYREHSRVEKQLFNGKLTRRLRGQREIEAVFTAMDNPVAEDPAGLTASQVEEDRRQATDDARRLDAGQEVDQQRLGLTYRDGAFANGSLTLRGFYTRRDFIQRLPFHFRGAENVPAFERDFYGTGLEYGANSRLLGRPLRFVSGIDIHRQVDERERFGTDADGNIIAKTQDERQEATNVGPFFQADLDVSERVDLNAGVRFDRVRFEIDDRFLSDGDQSGQRSFDEWSGTIGGLYTVAPGHRAYVNVGTAFETPSFAEFANPAGAGGFNPDIEPQKALNREIGLRGRLGGRVRYDLALFSVRVRDEIVPFGENPNGRTFYENAALTRREGLELGVDWIATDRITVAAAYTYGDHRFVRFTDSDGNVFDGNRLPGLPRHNLYLEGNWQTIDGRYASLSARYVGSLYANNANDVESDSFAVTDMRVGRRIGLPGERRADVFLGVDNVFDEKYIANTRINLGPGFFEPAPERTWIVGLEMGF